MKRLTLFAKGNVDLRDALHSYRHGDRVVWNGLNEILRSRFPGWTIRVRHETATRSDAMLAATGAIPADIAARDFDLGPHSAASQFSQALFATPADIVVLAIQPDVATALLRHRRDGYFFYPNQHDRWSDTQRQWVATKFDDTGLLDAAQSMRNLAAIIARLRAATAPHILVCNLSAVVPGEWLHSHEGIADTLSTRIRQFNLALIALSRETGISLIDVDTVVARAGADRLKIDALRLNAEGCRLVAEEVVRVLDDLGCFTEDP